MHSSASPVRKAAAELIGTAALVAVVVGSGLQAARLTEDTAVQLLANSLASAIGLGLLIALFGPVSGGHLNPVVTLSSWWLARREGGDGPGTREALAYVAAQTLGAVTGALLAEAMFGRARVVWSTQERIGDRLLLGEVVATAGLVLLICGLSRIGRPQLVPLAVAAYIAAAIWFTSSGSFANPAATVGRAFTDSFTGISPGSLPGFIVAQLAGGALGLALASVLYGKPAGRGGEGRPVGEEPGGEEPGGEEPGGEGPSVGRGISSGSGDTAPVRLP